MKINAKQLLAIAFCGLALAGCGGSSGSGAPSTGNGGSGSGNGGTQQPGGNGGSSNGGTPTSPPPSIAPFSTYLYSDTSYVDVPTITVYIDGQPVTLLADTGASGLIVNQSTVSIPNSDLNSSYTFSVTFGDGSSETGIMASATICINPSNTASCIVMPIGVITSGNAFPIGDAQGDFGLDSGLNIMDIGYNSSGSSITGYSYATYLTQQSGINSYTLSFYPLSNTFYANVSATTPIGQVSFGTYNGNSNTLIPYTINLFTGLPVTTGVFASATSSYTDSVIFDTGSNYNFFSTSMLQTEIPNFSQTASEGACANYGWPSNMVNGGFVISYTLQNYNQNYSSTFTTEPSLSFCQNNPIPNIIIGNTIDYGSGVFGTEDFGLPEMLRHTLTWVLDNGGLVQDIGISP
jgi:hypothetical protein